MPRLMDLGLEQLTNMVLDMGKLAERTVVDSLNAYQKSGLNSESIFHLSEQLRILRESTDDLAVELLARFQPIANDLRYIKSCIDVSYDLGRFGRYAYDISLTPVRLGDLSYCDFKMLLDMADKALVMIRKSMLAFKDRDAELAKTLKEDDDVIDQMYLDVLKSILSSKDVDAKCALAITLLARHIERIADHACYIADSVVYIVEGMKIGLH